MSEFLYKIIQKVSWKKLIILTLLFAVFYILINFSAIGVAELLRITDGANILDFEFGYTYEEAHNMLTALGTEGREFYLTRIMPLDYPFPFTYMLFYAGFIAFLLKHITSQKRYGYLLFIPLLAMLCDWIENIGIITMLNTYPNLPEWSVLLASIMGMLKTVFTIGSIIIILGLLIIFAYSKLRGK